MPPQIPSSPKATRATPRWLPPVLALLVFFIVLGVGGLVVTDWALRNAEMNALVAKVEVSEDSMGTLQGDLGATFDAFASQGQLTPDQRAKLNAQIQKVAGAGHDAVEKAGIGVEAVSVLPWDTAIVRAKDDYVRHNQAWQAYLAQATQDPGEVTRPQNEIKDSFTAAETPMKSAVPRPTLFHLKQRVDALFAPPAEPTTSNGPTQSVVLTAGQAR
jgi:hypothetical protein